MPAIPYFSFADGEASLAFLAEAFGFAPVTVQRDDAGGVLHAELRAGDVVVMGGQAPADAPAPTGDPGTYLVVEAVDATHARALSAGATEVWAPHDTEWGTRRSRLRDLDGHEWSLGTYVPGTAWS